RKDAYLPCGRRQAGGPGVRLEAGAVEVGLAPKALPARYGYQGLDPGAVGHDGNIPVVLPGRLQVSFGRGGGAAVAHVEPEHSQLEPVVIEQCIRHALPHNTLYGIAGVPVVVSSRLLPVLDTRQTTGV